jgi:tetratricopeptide (TPR) repeat protein
MTNKKRKSSVCPNYSQNLLYKIYVILFLVISTLALYWQVTNHAFIKFDDQIYLIENPYIRNGFSFSSVKWAFTSIYAANWHPLTWLSHMLDVQLFGMKPAGHHLVNLLLHTSNAVLLFLLLCRSTGALWRSAVVAVLFAIHPLHVESVAWAAERKDVLSTLFWILTLYFYTRYSERPNLKRYIATLCFFILGLLSKPMLVSVPFVMLLMDYWPLKRLYPNGLNSPSLSIRIRHLLIEKLPFLVLAIASCGITYYAQQSGNAMTELAASPLPERLSNAAISYVSYLEKTFWPVNLSVFYPYNMNIPIWQSLSAFVFLTIITVMVIMNRIRYPYLIIGWLWYLSTLIPVIGIVRVGLQSMADRYAYIPLTGVFIMAVWGLSDIINKANFRFNPLPYITATIITACGVTTWQQLGYWQSTKTLFNHADKAVKNNYMALYILGGELEKEGLLDEALETYNRSVSIAPWYEYAKINRDIILLHQGRLNAASVKYSETVLQHPDSVSGYVSLGVIRALQNRFEEAVNNFKSALALYPQSEEAHYNLALTLSQMEKLDEAVYHYRKALEINPNDLNTINNLGVTLANMGKIDEAITTFSTALQIKPDFFDARNNLELARKKQNSLPSSSH